MQEVRRGEIVESGIKFSEAQKETLRSLGYTIFELQGESIASLRKKGVSFWSKWHQKSRLEEEKSRASEVAIKLDSLFLPHSLITSIDEQPIFLNEYPKIVSKSLEGVVAVIGTHADYLELDFLCESLFGRGLFRRSGNQNNASTITNTIDDKSVFVGQFYDGSMVVSYRKEGLSRSDIGVIPLLIPH